VNLNQRYGALLSSGSYLENAQFVSDTRRFIVGRGYNAARGRFEVFVLDMGAEWIGRLTWLGTLGGPSSMATSVSDNGVVVGSSMDSARRWRAFRWTSSGGMQPLGVLGTLAGSYAWGVSSDGSVITGYSVDSAGRTFGFRWTQAQGMQALTPLSGGIFTQGGAVSGDGAFLVGSSRDGRGRWQAVRWSALGAAQGLGTLGGATSFATAASNDGSVVVGYGANASGEWRAFRWTPTTGMRDIGTLGGKESIAYGVSADGRTIVGISRDGSGRWQGFRWRDGAMQPLGAMTARSVSADGAVVVGSANGMAMLWDTQSGLRPLQLEYAPLLSPGSTLIEAYAISPNKRYIVGFGYNAQTRRREAFLLDREP